MSSKYFLKVNGIESLEIRHDTYNNVKYFLEKFKYKFECNQRFIYTEESYALCSKASPKPNSEYSIEIDYEVFKIIINCMSAQFRI